MPKVNLIDSLDHSLVSAIRNFSVAEEVLAEDRPDLLFAKDLLRASIAQLKAALGDLRESEKNQSTVAHEK